MRRLICVTLLAIAVSSNVGCFLPIYDADPAVRARQAIFASEDLRALRSAWQRFWFTDQPDHQKPVRTHGGIIWAVPRDFQIEPETTVLLLTLIAIFTATRWNRLSRVGKQTLPESLRIPVWQQSVASCDQPTGLRQLAQSYSCRYIEGLSSACKPLVQSMKVLSGIQPTGRPHWGNYFGAIRQYIQLQEEEQAFYFIADLHALTTIRDRELLRQNTLDMAIDMLALGLDPEKAVLFVQSDVPEVSELCWILLSGTPMGLLERCVSYKEKKDRGLSATAGLFTYPVLQAADILAYGSDTVPVGADQTQHVEVTRDIAKAFNSAFDEEVFVLPKAKVLDDSAKVPGLDGEKMSKSYDNYIEIFEPPKQMKKKVMRIATDSRPMEDPKEPETDHLFQLYSLFATDEQRQAMAAMYRAGGFGYGEVKKGLAEAADSYFEAAREKRSQLESAPEQVREILAAGADMARRKASGILLRAQTACGIK